MNATVRAATILIGLLAARDLFAAPREVCHTDGEITLHADRSIHAPAVGSLREGAPVDYRRLSRDRRWVEVRTRDGRRGWIQRSYVCYRDGAPLQREPAVTPWPGICRGRRGFGVHMHPIARQRRFHDGQDYGAPQGTPLRAPFAGTVVRAGRTRGYGYAVTIRRDNADGSADFFLFGHLCCGHRFRYGRSSIRVKPGQHVDAGQVIGQVGDTGYSKGSHLHLLTRHVPAGAASAYRNPATRAFFSRRYAVDPNRLLKVPSCGGERVARAKRGGGRYLRP